VNLKTNKQELAH